VVLESFARSVACPGASQVELVSSVGASRGGSSAVYAHVTVVPAAHDFGPDRNPGPTKLCADGSCAAFVVGVEKYPYPVRLTACAGDAMDMASLLHRKGYSVTRLIDPSSRALQAAFRRFVDSLQPVATVVLYFSGHGIQVGGVNYMLPVDALTLGEAQLYGTAQLW
jgi:hypothetical protein